MSLLVVCSEVPQAISDLRNVLLLHFKSILVLKRSHNKENVEPDSPFEQRVRVHSTIIVQIGNNGMIEHSLPPEMYHVRIVDAESEGINAVDSSDDIS